MSTPEPYTREEMTDDVLGWQAATDEQKLSVFDQLIGIVTSDAFTHKDADLIDRLRKMRAKRVDS
jgi:hypothetical protein